MTRCWTNSPFLIKVARVDSSFYLKMVFFKIARNVSKYLGYFWIVICCQELLKFAQSGHTSNLKRFIGSTPTPSIQEKFFASFCANRKNMFFEEGQNPATRRHYSLQTFWAVWPDLAKFWNALAKCRTYFGKIFVKLNFYFWKWPNVEKLIRSHCLWVIRYNSFSFYLSVEIGFNIFRAFTSLESFSTKKTFFVTE